MQNKTKNIYLLSFLLPIVLLLICFVLLNIFPFGERSFLYWDTNYEYINFFSYFKTIFTSNNNLLYSFSRIGGNNMMDFASFYNYLSPLNIILFLFPDKYLNIAIELMMLIKIGLCGLTFTYFINKEVKENYLSIFFGLSYALSTHTLITTMSNFILMDGIILLPLVIAGISRIIEKNDYRLYICSLFLTIITNGYMGYVAIVFSLIFLIYKMLIKEEKKIKEYVPQIRLYILSTLVAIGVNAWLLIPTLFSIQQGKYNYFDILERLFIKRYDIIGIISRFFTARLEEELFWAEIYPYLFVGILVLVLSVLYFFNGKDSRREKIVTLILFIFFIISSSFNCLFTLFNMGVEVPAGTIHRYSFIQTFFIIFISYKSLINIQAIKPKYILISLLILMITWIVVNYHFKYFKDIIFQLDITAIIVLCIIFFIISNLQKILYYRIGLIIIILIHLANLTYNTYYVFESQRNCLVSYSVKNFTNYVEIGEKALSYIKNADDGFYRIETPLSFADDKEVFYNNSAMLLNYNSISHYSSLGETKLKEFYRNIGYLALSHNNIGIAYRDTMALFPQMLTGVKYIISKNSLPEPFKKLKSIVNNKDRVNIYENPYSLPIAFMIDKNEIIYSPIEFKSLTDYQNSLVKILSQNDYGDIYKELKTINLKRERFDDINNYQEFTFKINNRHSGRLFLEIYEDFNMLVYYNNNMLNSYNKMAKFQTIYLPTNNNSDGNINLRLEYNDRNNNFYNYNVSIVSEDLNILRKYYNKLAKNPCELTKITSSHLKGKFNTDGNDKLIFMTIPYDKGWKIKINGKKRKAIKVFDAMMAIPVVAGENEIEMIYNPKGFKIGIIISLISILLLILNINWKRNISSV